MAAKSAGRSIPQTVGVCAEVADVLRTMGSDPNAQEIAWLWHTAFEAVEMQRKAGRSEKKAKRGVVRFLAQHAEFLFNQSVSAPGRENALRHQLNRKFKQWRMNGKTAACLVDRRAEANHKRRVVIPEQDIGRAVFEALQYHGGESAPAFRKSLERGELSPEISARYLVNTARRAHIPEAVARDLMPEAKLLFDYYWRPRYAKLNGAYIERDWSGVGAGDSYSADDTTLEIYAFLPDYTLTRGQFIPMIDERSKRILDFVLVPEKSYNSVNVRTLITKVCLRYGLPRRGFRFETGLWKNSKLLGGAVPVGEMMMNFAERLGLKIEHALPGNARAKIVENVLKIFQRGLRGQLGWVGPNEQVLKLESVQRAKLDAEAGRKTPHEAGFLSFEQWFNRPEELCEEYNDTVQDSTVMGAKMSPNEAWRLLQTRNADGEVIPLAKLPDDCRYLLASHVQRFRIGRNGIRLAKSLGGATYRNEVTGRLQHRKVTIDFDPEFPETLSLIPDDRSQVFTIPRAPKCPAYDATPEEIAAAQESVAAHTKYARQRVSQLRAEYMPPTRANIVDARTSATGREIKAHQEQTRAAEGRRKREQSKLAKLARQAGLDSALTKDSRALELLNEGLADEC